MKFTEDEAYNELVAKLKKMEANPLINERAIRAVISDDFKLFADVDIDLGKYTDIKVNTLKENDGNVRKVVSESITDIQKKEKERKEKEDEEKKAKSEEKHEDETKDAELKSLEEKFNQLLAKINQNESEIKMKQRKDDLLAEMEKQGIKDAKWARKAIEKFPISEESDLETEAKSLLELYNLSRAEINEFDTPLSPASNAKDEDILSSIKEQRESKLKEEKI